MSETVNPKFLELARHLRQFTQKEAAELLGVSQGKLSKAEKGLQPLPPMIIENLQTVSIYLYHFSTNQLMRLK